MAIYHLSAQVIGRSSGRSAVAAAAYRAGEELRDEHTGLTHDYSRRHDIDSWIQAPEGAP
ncbi:MAG: MobA/MobL family protein [Chloroflexota bacterium]|nr:MobA/MobL family protein [Chloroflexota bacterium]